MKKLLATTLALTLGFSSLAYAQSAPTVSHQNQTDRSAVRAEKQQQHFEKHKQMMSQKIDKRQEHLAAKKSCVNAAQDRKSLDACHNGKHERRHDRRGDRRQNEQG